MSMYFMQHGECVAKEIDPDRPLSEEGRRQVECVAAHLKRCGISAAQIFHSGKTRARQTAEILSEHIAFTHIDECSGMNPNDAVAEFAATLEDNSMYVGHLPHLGKLVAYLATGAVDADVLHFTNAAVACIGRDDSGYYVEWYLPPALCPIPSDN